jgi:autotransporter strand-loop-strand O-heptosyltransferase
MNNGHYHFIEIGTSDFDTLIQTCSDESVGLSIEPLQMYLDRLPNKPNVKKITAAVSDVDSEIDIYYIPLETVFEYNLPVWVRGCNSVTKPHDFTRNKLGEEFYDEIVQCDTVPTVSWETLVSRYNVKSLDLLKIDTEGHDHIILKSYLTECEKNPKLYANKIIFEYNEGSNKFELDKIIKKLPNYDVEIIDEDVILTKRPKHDKAYVLYANESYFDIVKTCAKSIREFSELPIYVYLLNSDLKIDIPNTTTIKWECNLNEYPDEMYLNEGENFYINRGNSIIYHLLIQRPLITKDALKNHAETVVYVDSDSVATPYIDNIFNLYDSYLNYPYFVEGIYDWMHFNGRGGAETRDDLSTTLEHSACELFGVNQYVRQRYRQTGYYIAGQNCIDFLNEWYWMCINPKILKNFVHYAPYHEETIMNVLLWKYNIMDGLPYIYVNGGSEVVDKMYTEVEFKGPAVRNHISSWLRAPESKEMMMFFHGEKRIDKMEEMIEKIKHYHTIQPSVPVIKERNKNLKVLFLAPHLSTGGMPGFLLRRIEVLLEYCPEIEIFVVEYSNYSPVYVVQRNKIKELLPSSNFFELGSDKMDLIRIIKENNIDVVHVDEMLEGFDTYNQVSPQLMNALYDNDRTWRMVETCHNVWFDPGSSKRVHPDAYAFCTPYHKEKTFVGMPSHGEVLEFPIDNNFRTRQQQVEAQNELGFDPSKTHVINVGLWTSGKNQKEGVELAKLLVDSNPEIQFHFIGNQAPNFKSYWEPIMESVPSNVKVWGERSDVSTFMRAADVFMFNSTWECNPLVLREAASYGLKILSRNLPQYMNMFTPYITPIDDNLELIKEKLLDLILQEKTYSVLPGQSEKFALDHKILYQLVADTEPKPQSKINPKVQIVQHFVEQPYIEIKGESDSKFEIKVFDGDGINQYHNTLGVNHWARMNRMYYTKWNTKVWEDGTLIYENTLDYEGKRVFITFDSSSLGDTIAWLPYCLEFQKKHKCHVIVSTFKNFLFQDAYPELEFVERGSTVHNLYGMYHIGWFYNVNREPEVPNTIPLQKTITNILGLDFEEIKPRISYKVGQKPYEGKYVTIATNSTSGCKFWTKEAWQELIDYLHLLGYKIINVSKENNPFNHVTKIKDTSMESTMNVIHHSEFFIGLSSGLSWLAWAMGKHVVMISNFTEPDHEFTTNCTRIVNLDVCNGCWNNPMYKFDKGDWNWCPVLKGTNRQFECHKSITSDMVINQIQHLL